MAMHLASWNVNSIKARHDIVLRWLTEQAPDVLMIQELKGTEFPAHEFEALGYHITSVPQKAYNGVAILSKQPPALILDRLPGDDSDEQARYVEVALNGLRLINIYAPNGNPLGTEKFPYKLNWLERLYRHAAALRQNRVPFLIAGDFNIIPEEIDCYSPAAWLGDALFQPESRALYRRFLNLGLTDALRAQTRSAGIYTFWDYQAGGFPANKGIRIDHFLLSPQLSDRLESCAIDIAPRGWDKPSDHTPISIKIRAE